MLLWFAVLAPVLVAEIFKSPLVDYRLVVVGALVPMIDVVVGQPSILHTLVGSVGLLAVVMLATIDAGPIGRVLKQPRLLRRRLLGVPIGMFFHLVLDGAWASAQLFWWPVTSTELGAVALPETEGVGWRLALEVVAIAVAVVAYRRYGLDIPANRDRLRQTGHLSRHYVS